METDGEHGYQEGYQAGYEAAYAEVQRSIDNVEHFTEGDECRGCKVVGAVVSDTVNRLSEWMIEEEIAAFNEIIGKVAKRQWWHERLQGLYSQN